MSRTGAPFKNAGGFTLIENLFTLFVTMFVLLALTSLAGSVVFYNNLTKNRSIARALLDQKFADITRAGFYDPKNAVGTYVEPDPLAVPPVPTPAGYSNFRRVTVVAQTSVSTTALRTATVTVSWDQDRFSLSQTMLLAP